MGKECRWVGMAAQAVQIESSFSADQGGIVALSALQIYNCRAEVALSSTFRAGSYPAKHAMYPTFRKHVSSLPKQVSRSVVR